MNSRVDPTTITLRAVIGRIIPTDHDPGALDLAADLYVTSQLFSDEGLAAPIWQGLAQLDALAAMHFGRGFGELAADQQDELIAINQETEWFAALAELTAEGFYADPGNGGNRDALSWRMIGYEHRLPEGPNGPMLKAETEAGE